MHPRTLPRPYRAPAPGARWPSGGRATLSALDPQRQSAPEKGAYDILRAVLLDLTSAERALTIVQEAAPDDERARHLTAIRRALEQLRTFL